MQTPEELKERIRGLETERAHLQNELEKLRKAAENHAAELEEDINRMREEAKILNEIVVADEKNECIPPVTQPNPPLQANLVAPATLTEPEVAHEPTVSASMEDEAKGTKSEFESILKTLTANERKVVELLLAHEGKYRQRLIRTEAGLSWLETRRIISHLSERGVATTETSGAEAYVTLANKWKQSSV